MDLIKATLFKLDIYCPSVYISHWFLRVKLKSSRRFKFQVQTIDNVTNKFFVYAHLKYESRVTRYGGDMMWTWKENTL